MHVPRLRPVFVTNFEKHDLKSEKPHAMHSMTPLSMIHIDNGNLVRSSWGYLQEHALKLFK